MFRASTAHHHDIRCVYMVNGTSKMTVSQPRHAAVILEVPLQFDKRSKFISTDPTNYLNGADSFWRSSSSSQETPCMLRKSNIYYAVRKVRPPVAILSQINPVQAPTLPKLFL
jgi:hypothetical protein